MKLTELAIDGYQDLPNFKLGRFSEGLNFVYGENGAGKSALCDFFRSVLLGHSKYGHQSLAHPHGHVGLKNGLQEFRVDRDLSGARRCHAVIGGSALPEQVLSGLTPDVFDSIFCFSLRDSRINAKHLAVVLNSRLGVARGATAAGDDYAFQNWKRESDARSVQLHSIQSRMEELKREQAGYANQIESRRAKLRAEVAELDSQIQSLAIRLNSGDVHSQQNRLVAVENEIAQLRTYIDNAVQHVTYLPQPATPTDPFAALYQRLDEIDNQIRRWRHVQSDVQAQRVKLKDDMVVWNDLKLESDDHPYHNAREILLALEDKVNHAERSAERVGTRRWLSQRPIPLGGDDPGSLSADERRSVRTLPGAGSAV